MSPLYLFFKEAYAADVLSVLWYNINSLNVEKKKLRILTNSPHNLCFLYIKKDYLFVKKLICSLPMYWNEYLFVKVEIWMYLLLLKELWLIAPPTSLEEQQWYIFFIVQYVADQPFERILFLHDQLLWGEFCIK